MPTTSKPPVNVLPVLGELLKRQREAMGLSEKEISVLLNQHSANFVSLIERGACSIPLSKVDDITRAYRLDPDFTLVLIKYLHPEVWCDAARTLDEGKRLKPGFSRDAIESRIDDCLRKKLDEHGLGRGELISKVRACK